MNFIMALAGSIPSGLRETLILALTNLISFFKVDITLNIHLRIWILLFHCDCLLCLTSVHSVVSSYEDFLRTDMDIGTELKGKQCDFWIPTYLELWNFFDPSPPRKKKLFKISYIYLLVVDNDRSLLSFSRLEVPYTRHYNPQFVFFYPIFHCGLYWRAV